MPVVTRTTRSTVSKPPPDLFQITTRQKENLTTETHSAQRLETKIRLKSSLCELCGSAVKILLTNYDTCTRLRRNNVASILWGG